MLRSAVCLGAAGLLVVLSLAWLSSRATIVRTELQAAMSMLPELKENILQGDAEESSRTVSSLRAHTTNARDAANDPLWRLAGSLPWVGINFQATTEIATTADDVVKLGASPLVSVLGSLNWASMTPNGGGIDVTPLAEASPALVSAANAVQQSSERLNRIDSTQLLSQISDPLEEAQGQLTSLRASLQTAADFAALAPDMLGRQEPRDYLLLVENNAEARATGGIPGALAILSIDNGRLTMASQSSATELGTFSPPIALDEEQQRIYSIRLGKFMQDANLTPDFPTAASTAQAMWERKFNQRVDGVVSVDPVTLGYLLEATGPVTLPDQGLLAIGSGSLPHELTSANVIPTLLSDVYLKIADPEDQDAYFASVAKAVFEALSTGNGDDKALLDAIAKGAAERRILLWSATKSEQETIERYSISGSISGHSVAPAEFGVYFNDSTGAKLDYYVKRSVQLIKECSNDGYEQTTVRITSTNTAPSDAASSLPPYVTGDGNYGVPVGSVQTNIMVYGPAQSNVETAKLDGERSNFAPYRHSDRPVGMHAVRLAPGETRTLDFTFGRIVQHTEPTLVVTPSIKSVNEVIGPTVTAACG